jgi:hypothetical protein
MTNWRILLCSIDELLVHRFVTEHLPACFNPLSQSERCVSGARTSTSGIAW